MADWEIGVDCMYVNGTFVFNAVIVILSWPQTTPFVLYCSPHNTTYNSQAIILLLMIGSNQSGRKHQLHSVPNFIKSDRQVRLQYLWISNWTEMRKHFDAFNLRRKIVSWNFRSWQENGSCSIWGIAEPFMENNWLN